MRLSYTNLLGCFTLKIYSSVPTTWSTPMKQQPPIAPVNMLQSHWMDEGLQPKIESLNPLNERSGIVWLIRLSLKETPFFKKI